MSPARRSARFSLRTFLPLIIALFIVVVGILLIRWILSNNTERSVDGPVASYRVSSGTVYLVLSDGQTRTTVPARAEPYSIPFGEGLATGGGTRLEVTLQDGSLVRLDENTQVRLELYRADNTQRGRVRLDRGRVAVRPRSGPTPTPVEILGNFGSLQLTQGLGFVDRTDQEEIYRMAAGNGGTVRIFNETPEKLLLEQTLALGQEIKATAQLITSARQGESVRWISVLSSDFQDSAWYQYNLTREQGEPLSNGSIGLSSSSESPLSDGAESSSGSSLDTGSIDSSGDTGGPSLAVTTPRSGSTVTESRFVLSGTVSAGAKEVYVNSYKLGKFTTGARNWSYNVSVSNENLVTGRNVYEVYAVDAEGRRGPLVRHVIFYAPGGSSDTGSLTAPAITAPSRGGSYQTRENSITVRGTVSAGTSKVLVNGTALTKYVAGSSVWEFRVSTNNGTLSAGDNTYTIVAVDSSGKRSPATTYRITYTSGGNTGSGSTVR